MSKHINIVAFGTFGNPNGFRQSFFSGRKDLTQSIRTFDLNTNAIKLFPESKLYSIRKEKVYDIELIAYGVYSYAKEPGSDRSGTFVGSAFIYIDRIPDENLTITQLNEFHDYLISSNVDKGVIVARHSDDLNVRKPRDFDKLEYNLKPLTNIKFTATSEKILVVFCKTGYDKFYQTLKIALDLLNVYDCIYFTESKEVAEFVNKKGIFKLIQNVGERKDLEQELSDLHDYRKKQRENAIQDIKNAIQKVKDSENKDIERLVNQIKHSERIQHENEIKLKDLRNKEKKTKSIYIQYIQTLNTLIEELKSGEDIEKIKKAFAEYANRFNVDIKQQIVQVSLAELPPSNTISSSSSNKSYSQPTTQSLSRRADDNHKENGKSWEVDKFKVISLVLGILLIFMTAYIVFRIPPSIVTSTPSPVPNIKNECK